MKTSEISIARRIIRRVDSAVDSVVLVLLVMILLFGVYSLVDSKLVYMSADAANYEVYRPTPTGDAPPFQELQKINPDVFGWLTVIDTHIDYPLVQGEDNEKYVNTNPLGEYSMVGSLFLDYRNHPDFSDFTNIIYGHHMEQNMMFGNLEEFQNKVFFDQHPYANLTYGGKKHGVELFAYMLADAYDGNIYRIVDKDAAQSKATYLSYIKQNATNYRELNVSPEDTLVILSTCSEDITNGRFIVAGRIVDKPFKEPDRTQRRFGLGLGNSTGFFALLPLWKWGILLFILILILACLISWLIDRRKMPPEERPSVAEDIKKSIRRFIPRN